ncbi:hypothetical protein [Catellatospora tritici]|uniref:hypothetical protein n=1 Tax=Catellatospora tritici TaxID=2851566 RepID=UPI001C2D1015|nr:hypothetical protein [Catellatospora tritici]MBV1855828.1 hypothetical protein [Catellatospora tritici]
MSMRLIRVIVLIFAGAAAIGIIDAAAVMTGLLSEIEARDITLIGVVSVTVAVRNALVEDATIPFVVRQYSQVAAWRLAYGFLLVASVVLPPRMLARISSPEDRTTPLPRR